MPACCAYNPRCRITFRIFGVSMIKSSETTARAHLVIHISLKAGCKRTNKTNLLLIGETTKVFTVRIPCNQVCVAWTQLRILLVAGNLPSLEPKAGVDAKCLIVEEPRMDSICEKERQHDESTYAVSFAAVCQFGGKFTDGMGHAGQRTASSPDDVPLIPEWL